MSRHLILTNDEGVAAAQSADALTSFVTDIDVTDDTVFIVRVKQEEFYPIDPWLYTDFVREEIERVSGRKIPVLLLDASVPIESLDLATMRRHGWVRRKTA